MNQAINLINEMIKEEQDTYDKCFVQILQEAKKRISSLHSDTQWIDVSDKLPELGSNVLWLWSDNRYQLGVFKYTDDGFPVVDIGYGTYGVHNLPFWMPLPLPPNN